MSNNLGGEADRQRGKAVECVEREVDKVEFWAYAVIGPGYGHELSNAAQTE